MTITADSDIRQQSVSAAGAYAKLTGTPLELYASLLISLAEQYGLDLNWALSYLAWENGFGAANSFSMAYNNPWDIVGVWETARCADPGNGYCYAVYPSMQVGLQAGFDLWASYVGRGWVTWQASLSVALCGDPAGCPGSDWVAKVIAQGAENAARWPYSPPPPGGIPPSGLVLANPVLALFLGGGLALGGLIALERLRRKR